MAFRNLFDDFLKERSKHRHGGPHSRKAPGIEPDGIHLANMGPDLEQEQLCAEDKPDWTVIVDNVRGRFDQLEIDLKDLSSVHQSQLRQGIDDSVQDEKARKASELTDRISLGFTFCHKWIDLIVRAGVSNTPDHRVRKNVQVALATKLQKLSSAYRKETKMFMQRLHSQSSASNSHDDPFAFVAQWDLEDDDQFMFSEAQRAELDSMSDLVDERDREVQAIAKSIVQLSEIFKELSTLVIDSGTILDRIDFNMEMVHDNVHAAEDELTKASKINGKGISAWCIIFLSVACVIMLIVVIAKKAS